MLKRFKIKGKDRFSKVSINLKAFPSAMLSLLDRAYLKMKNEVVTPENLRKARAWLWETAKNKHTLEILAMLIPYMGIAAKSKFALFLVKAAPFALGLLAKKIGKEKNASDSDEEPDNKEPKELEKT